MVAEDKEQLKDHLQVIVKPEVMLSAITQMSISMSISGGRNAWRSVSMHVDISFRKSSIIQLWDIEDIISFGVLQSKKYSLENRLYSPFAFSHERNQKKRKKKMK